MPVNVVKHVVDDFRHQVESFLGPDHLVAALEVAGLHLGSQPVVVHRLPRSVCPRDIVVGPVNDRCDLGMRRFVECPAFVMLAERRKRQRQQHEKQTGSLPVHVCIHPR